MNGSDTVLLLHHSFPFVFTQVCTRCKLEQVFGDIVSRKCPVLYRALGCSTFFSAGVLHFGS